MGKARSNIFPKTLDSIMVQKSLKSEVIAGERNMFEFKGDKFGSTRGRRSGQCGDEVG